jgi:hypothetical protein
MGSLQFLYTIDLKALNTNFSLDSDDVSGYTQSLASPPLPGRMKKIGKIGDGKIFVSSIEDAVRIRNGDREENAL